MIYWFLFQMGIIGCPYCSFEGVERYQVSTHIKEEHKDCEQGFKVLDNDLDGVVAEYYQNWIMGRDPTRSPAPWNVKKVSRNNKLIVM